MRLGLVRKETRRPFGFVGRGLKSGNCFYCFKFEGLIVDSVCDTPYSQVAFVALQLPSKVAREGMTSYPVLSAQGSPVPRHTSLSRFKPVVACNPYVKATVSKAVIQVFIVGSVIK